MGQRHASTPEQRAQWATMMLAHEHEYGFVTELSASVGVSRPTLYAWKARALQALEQAFAAPTTSTRVAPALATQVLTLLVEGHNSYANIQVCLRRLTHQQISIGTIAAIVQEAQERALAWMASHAPESLRSLALDEIYAHNRQGAYLNVVDTESWAVWAAAGPLPVDAESWTLLLWLAQERGLKWHSLISDGGDAIGAACRTVDPEGRHARDHWHIFHTFAQVQGRLRRQLRTLEARTPTVARQAARIAAGQKARGGRPRTDLGAHEAEVAALARCGAELRALGSLLRAGLEVVVVARGELRDDAGRRADLDALLELLSALEQQAPSGAVAELKRLHTQLRLAAPALLRFVAPLEEVHRRMQVLIGSAGVGLIGWAWLRRTVLGWQSEQVVAALPAAWQQAARVLMHAWERAPRASSAVENWHSILRPHLAVHRTLSSGLLALLAVWHNHRVFTRGVHKGHSPLHLSGMVDAPTDWLVALGYGSAEPTAAALPPDPPPAVLALVA